MTSTSIEPTAASKRSTNCPIAAIFLVRLASARHLFGCSRLSTAKLQLSDRPDPGALVFASCGQPGAVGAERYRCHRVVVTELNQFLPARRVQILALVSELAVASRVPSGLNATDVTALT